MIKGLRPSLAQAGAIKIGRLSDQEYTSGKGTKFRRPVKLDHFLVVKNTRDAAGQLEIDHGLMAALPKDSDGNCRSIPIILHSDEIENVFPTTYAAYQGKKIACRGDGETATVISTGEARKCPCKYLDEGKCKPHGTLHCTIAIPNHAIAGAVYRWRTTGIISITRMIGSLQQILGAVGVLTNIPLMLRVQPVQVSPDGRPQTVYCCHIELHAADLLSVQEKALKGRETRKLLNPAPVEVVVQPPAYDESPEEQAEVEAEFFPPDETPEPEPPGRTEAVKRAAKKTAKAASAKETREALEETKKSVTEPPPDEEPPPPGEAEAPDYGQPDET